MMRKTQILDRFPTLPDSLLALYRLYRASGATARRIEDSPRIYARGKIHLLGAQDNE